MFSVKKYVPEVKPFTIFSSDPEDVCCNSLMQLHLDLLMKRKDYSEPLSIKFSCAPIFKSVPGAEKFNEKVSKFGSLEEFDAEHLETPGVFPDSIYLDLGEYGNLPEVLIEVFKKAKVCEVKDVFVGLPVWLLGEDEKYDT